MNVKIEYFGLILEITEKDSEILELSDKSSIHDLKQLLLVQYPDLMNKPFVFALNQSIVKENAVLKTNDVIALLPPFAGG